MVTTTVTLLSACLAGVAAVCAADRADTEKAKLQGTWVLVYSEFEGVPFPRVMTEGRKVTFNGDKYCRAITIKGVHDRTFVWNGTFKLAPSPKPSAIDFTEIGDNGKAVETRRGIYHVRGDKLRVCIGGPADKRPSRFQSRKGDHRFVEEYTRQR